MGRLALRRLVALPLILLIAASLAFLFMRLAPGDPAEIILGLYADAKSLANLRHELGLDQSLPLQYLSFLAKIVRLDLGTSFRTGQPVLTEMLSAATPTLVLSCVSIVIATVLGVGLGVVAAMRPNSIIDYFTTLLGVLGVSTPVFWIGMLSIFLFSVRLDLLPSNGYGGPIYLVLPALTLCLHPLAVITRMTRSEMLDVLGKDYIRTARAKGLAHRVVIFRHALKNALLPVTTVIGMSFGLLLTGSVLVETVFSWPGLGRLLIAAVEARDYAIIQGTVILTAAVFLLLNLVVDLAHAWLDPRSRINLR